MRICFIENGQDFHQDYYENISFSIGEKIVIENGKLYVIKDIQHQLGNRQNIEYQYIMCNIILEEVEE